MASVKTRPKQVNYLSKNFTGFKSDLMEFAKTYFPTSYADFNESSPGMMFIEMASYVGDVLSFYIDEQFRESLLVYAEERKTIFDIAQSYGYKPIMTTPAVANIDFFQTVPATGTGANVKPDYNYGHLIKIGSTIESEEYSRSFRTLSEVDFKHSSSMDNTTADIYELDEDGVTPTKYLLKKSCKAVSGTEKTETFEFTNAVAYDQVKLGNGPVLEIISVKDSDGNDWYEVESLAQDIIYDDVENTAEFDENLAAYNETVPYILKLIRTQKRYKTKIDIDKKTILQFGSGTATAADEEVIPNPTTVGNSFTNSNYLNNNSALDPANFLTTAVYGAAPTNTTLTVVYTIGGGIESNVPSNSITTKRSLITSINSSGLDQALVRESFRSIAVNNPVPATGGRGEESLKEIKENTRQYFQAQNRSVSKEDYITRIYNLPPKYGNIAKVYITQDDQINAGEGVIQEQTITQQTLDEFGGEIPISKVQQRMPNPMALNFYVLGFNHNKKLTTVNQATKKNIKTYLGPYRILTDAVNLKDAYVINIGVRFSLYVKKGFNKQEVILKCIDNVRDYFDPDKWQINQPIILADIAYEISLVDGVNNVVPPISNNPSGNLVVVDNKFNQANGYSGNIYDIQSATKNGIVYPSLDPAIFELKFPEIDIVGKVLGDY